MRTLAILSFIIILDLFSCKKQSLSKFEAITRQEIVANLDKMNGIYINYDNPDQPQFKSGSIILFKTNSGTFGKIEVVSVSDTYKLEVNVTTFDLNGNKQINASNIPIIEGKYYDFDTSVSPLDYSNSSDFGWEKIANAYYYITQLNATAFLYLK